VNSESTSYSPGADFQRNTSTRPHQRGLVLLRTILSFGRLSFTLLAFTLVILAISAGPTRILKFLARLSDAVHLLWQR
jgi:hypothetical protein